MRLSVVPAKRQPLPAASMVSWLERLGCSGGRRASTASGGSGSCACAGLHPWKVGDPGRCSAPDLETANSGRPEQESFLRPLQQ